MIKLLLPSMAAFLLVGCGGGGSTDTELTSNTISPKAFYSISTDIANIAYPESYTSNFNNKLLTTADPCNLNFSNVSVPKEWMGQFSFPTIKNAPLKSNIVRAVQLTDVLLHDNPGFILNKGCKDDLQAELLKTVIRLKELGVEEILVTQWHWIGKNLDGSWYFTDPVNTFSSLSDLDLAALVRFAHSFGIKIMILNQIQAMSDDPYSIHGPHPYIPEKTYDNKLKWFAAFRPFSVERAIFYQSIGVDAIEVGCSSCIFTSQPDDPEQSYSLYYNQYVSIITDIRKVFNGKIMMINPLLDQDFLNLLDIIGLYPVPTIKLTTAENKNLTVESYKVALSKDLQDKTIRWWITNNKPLMIQFGIQSRANALIDADWVEESSCNVSSGLFAAYTTSTNCIQDQLKPDFSLQAIVTEATLEWINELPLPPGSIVNSLNYWATDIITPASAYPNIGMSVRNKPAESILKAWYKK